MRKSKFSLIFSIATCVLSLVLLVTVCFAWFVNNLDTGTDGLDFVTSNPKISFGKELVTTRKFAEREITTTYERSDSGEYVNPNETDENGKPLPFSISGLMPTESIDITVTLSAELITDKFTLDLGISGIKGDTFEYEEQTFNVLGVFCVYPYSYKDNEFVRGERKWFCEYTQENKNNVNSSMTVISDSWENFQKNEDNSRTLKFRIAVDLEQYQSFNIKQSNLLSQKSIEFGSIYALVKV